MIRADQIKLDEVQEENYPDQDFLLDALNGAIEQGRQGWGVRREQAVMLGLAKQLKIALTLAETATAAQNALKGSQMALGRVKKQRDDLTDTLNQATLEKVETNARLDGMGKRIKELESDWAELS